MRTETIRSQRADVKVSLRHGNSCTRHSKAERVTDGLDLDLNPTGGNSWSQISLSRWLEINSELRAVGYSVLLNESLMAFLTVGYHAKLGRLGCGITSTQIVYDQMGLAVTSSPTEQVIPKRGQRSSTPLRLSHTLFSGLMRVGREQNNLCTPLRDSDSNPG